MNIVIDLDLESKNRLEEEAKRRGIPSPECASELIRQGLRASNGQRTSASSPPTGFGKFAHLPLSSEDFARRKQEEIDREDCGWQPKPRA